MERNRNPLTAIMESVIGNAYTLVQQIRPLNVTFDLENAEVAEQRVFTFIAGGEREIEQNGEYQPSPTVSW